MLGSVKNMFLFYQNKNFGDFKIFTSLHISFKNVRKLVIAITHFKIFGNPSKMLKSPYLEKYLLGQIQFSDARFAGNQDF